MTALPAAAAVAVVGVGALLLLTGEDERQPAPARPPVATTASTIPRESPQLRWVLLSGSGVEGVDRAVDPATLGFESGSAYDLERQATVARLRRTGPGPGSAQLVDQEVVDLEPGERRTFSAWLRVSGNARAWLGMRLYAATPAERGRPGEVGGGTSRSTGPGSWQRHEVALVVPEGANVITFSVHFEGEGEVAVDDVVGS